MGTKPITPTFETGDDCELCGCPDLGENTPRYIEAHISGIVDCPGAILPAPDGVYLLEQFNVRPCIWGTNIGIQSIILNYENEDSIFEIQVTNNILWFQHQTGLKCSSSFINQLVLCGGDIQATGGTVTVFWGPTIGP